MFSRWPRKRSHEPAAEMWSVVHLPLALRSSASSPKSFAVGVDHDLDARAVVGRGEEALHAALEPPAGQLLADRRLETRAVDVVGEGVEVERAGQRVRDHDLG